VSSHPRTPHDFVREVIDFYDEQFGEGEQPANEKPRVIIRCVRIPDEIGRRSRANRPPFQSKSAGVPEQIGHPWGKEGRRVT